MSLKDEIEKIIRAERKKLESRDREDQELAARQSECFQPLRRLLEELGASVDPKYIEVTIAEDSATIEIGTREMPGERLTVGLDLKIATSFKRITDSEPIFLITRNSYGGEVFDTEEEVIRYLVGEIARKIAGYQYFGE